jgi:hypothetical protein
MAHKNPRWGSLLVASVLLSTRLAGAQETSDPEPPAAVSKSECFTRHEEAQVRRREGRLLDARAGLRVCSGASCPAAIRADCVDWLDQVGRSVPTIVVTARAKGIDLTDVRVFIDDRLATERLSGAAIEIDPGQHKLRFEAPPWPALERNVLISEGVKGRSMDVDFAPLDELPRAPAPAATAVAPQTTFRLQTSDYVTGGIAAASLVTAGYLGATAISEKRQLERDCAPACSDDQAGPVRTKLLVADIALGVAVVSLAVGLYLHLTGKGSF